MSETDTDKSLTNHLEVLKQHFTSNPYRPNPGRREKIKLNVKITPTSLWCLKRFYEGIEDLHKTFEAPQRSVKIKI